MTNDTHIALLGCCRRGNVVQTVVRRIEPDGETAVQAATGLGQG